ncbi:MAG: glycosyltransferase family 2 protein [Fidelibacterota bacterium]
MNPDTHNGYIIIPAYNAEKTLPELLQRIRACCPFHILVVDDGSKDHTAQIADREGVHLIHHPKNMGKGKALQSGFQYVSEAGGDFAITLDADLQHPPEAIPGLVVKYTEAPGTFMIGWRQRDDNMPLHRQLSNYITSFLVSRRTGMTIPDVQCGFRLIPGKYLHHLLNGSKGFVFEAEMVIRLADIGVPVDFYPIPTIYLKGGHSSIAHIRDTLHFISMFTRSLFRRFS